MPANALRIASTGTHTGDLTACGESPLVELLARTYAALGKPVPFVLRKADVAHVLSIAVRTLERRVSTGDFPEPDHVESRKSVGWKLTTVITWFEQRDDRGPSSAERRPPAARTDRAAAAIATA